MGDLRVLLVDDHPVVRRGLAALLGAEAGLQVVAQAADGPSSVREAVLHRPDVVLMDLRLPGDEEVPDGIAATRRIRAALPGTRVLVLTLETDPTALRAALVAGAGGVLAKGSEADDIVHALAVVAGGHVVLPAGLAGTLLAPTVAPTGLRELSAREREVLALLVAGLPSAAIAQRLGLATKTVSNRISEVLTKLGVATRAEAVAIARRDGFAG
ncbi:response regulator [Kineococcus gynurae]|uniref:Response regulator n=1 Tax=Kineococcus gynurae TaxID=452979 RepID=A0ABV5LNW9_9ACTN